MARKFPARLLPSDRLKAEWSKRGKALSDPTYSRRWAQAWTRVLTILDQQGTWDDRDLGLLEEYIEWLRKAEDHRAEAEAKPYQVHKESGRTFAHPGFQLEVVARREARTVAHQLAIPPEARREVGIDAEVDHGPKGDQAGL